MSRSGDEKLAVVVGSGSAGYRHASALRRRDPGLQIVVVRRPTSTQPLERINALDIELVTSVEEAAAMRPSIAVIAGPASTHRRDAEIFAGFGAHLWSRSRCRPRPRMPECWLPPQRLQVVG